MSSPDLLERFQARVVGGLPTNSVLRGAWAEEVAAHYLGNCQFSEPWTYFDFDWEGRKVSVKHSVGSAARFAVARSKWAWGPEGWEEPPAGLPGSPQYWCDLYLFAWLDLGQKVRTPPTLDQVLDPAQWRFAALSKSDMERTFPPDARTVGLSVLAEKAPFVDGTSLPSAAKQVLQLG